MASLSNINGLFDVHSTGAILFSTSHGTSGQILKSNGNAAPTWVAASTVIGGPYLPLTGGTLTGATATASGISFTVGGDLNVSGVATLNDLDVTDTLAWRVSGSDAARQRADARDDGTTFSRLHWFGKSDTAGTSNFRHAYYDGAAYINVTASAGIITYTGGATFTGLVSGITPTAAANFATKAYVDAHPGSGGTVTSIATSNGITGGTITTTGTVSLNGTYSGRWNPTGIQIVDSRSGDVTPANEGDYSMKMRFTNQIPGNGNWQSLIQMKGWHDGYTSWQIIGPSTTTAYENWYLRSGLGSTWNTAREIWHSGNFTPGNYLPVSNPTFTGTLTGPGATFGGNVVLDVSNARLRIKSGAAGTNGGIDWTYNTASTQYARIDLNYDTRATTGLLIDSGYPITLDFSSGRFAIQHNGSEKMRIDSSGRVGINTTVFPSSGFAKLVVAGGAIAARPSGVNDYFSYIKSNWANENAFEIGIEGAGTQHKFITSGNYYHGTELRFWTSDTRRMTIDSAGQVGIGTVTPEQKLHVEGRGVFDGGSSSDILQIRNDNGGGVFGMTSNLFALDLASTSNFRIRQGSSVPLYLKSNGNLGIGTTTPYNRIHSSGVLGVGTANQTPGITSTMSGGGGGAQYAAGSLYIVQGYAGVMSSGDTFTFIYEATSWKAWSLEFVFTSTDGMTKGTEGGYNNSSAGHSSQMSINHLGCTAVTTNVGQHVKVVFTFTSPGTHPMAKLTYSQSGGDGVPRADRVNINWNT